MIEFDKVLSIRQSTNTVKMFESLKGVKQIMEHNVNACIENPLKITLKHKRDGDYSVEIEAWLGRLAQSQFATTRLIMDALLTRKITGNGMVTITLGEYMNMRGLLDVETCRGLIRKDLELMQAMTVRGKLPRGGMFSATVLCYFNIVDNIVKARFTEEFLAILGNTYLNVPNTYFKADIKNNPWRVNFENKLRTHAAINTGKTNACVISIESLLDTCADVDKDTRRFKQLLLNRFENNMNAIKGMEWKYNGEYTKRLDFLDGTITFTLS